MDSLESLLNRPASDRLREWKYRFAQSFVFGLPVLALQCFGGQLGGAESGRWVGLLQALLSGWVMYVGAAGVFFEGILLLGRGRLTLNLLISMAALALYVGSLFSWVFILIRGHPWPISPTFDWAVAIILIWSGLQWARTSYQMRLSSEDAK